MNTETQVVDSNTLALLNKSEIDQQITTAKQYPRSVKHFRSECMDMVTLTEQIADECIYALPRGGKVIEGPSARFAEVIASAWGNCRAGARVVAEDQDFVTAQGAFHDLEKNVAITYEVKRRITDKHGRRFNADMIGVTANAACSIALRNAILKGIPKAFWQDMYQAAKTTSVGDETTLTKRRQAAIDYLTGLGVLPEAICATLNVPGIEDIGVDELIILKGIATAIKEGDTTAEQAFSDTQAEPSTPGDGNASASEIAESVRKKSEEKTGKKKTAPANDSAPTTENDDLPPVDDTVLTPSELIHAVMDATNLDDLEAAYDLAQTAMMTDKQKLDFNKAHAKQKRGLAKS